jgi:predicted metal-dependent hydrolase
MDTKYRVEIIEDADRASHFGTLSDLAESPTIILELTKLADQANKSKAVRSLLSRLSANKYLPEITNRVHELNDLHFRQSINDVKLRLTQSRWGSCSSSGNINLSSRLLLVPPAVRDSVIIHELAHRIEMNHGSRFWKLVYDAMPDYETHHSFLDTHGKKYAFIPE